MVAQTLRKNFSMKTANVVLVVVIVAVASYLAGFHTPKPLHCAELLQDGRKLISITYNGIDLRCKYSLPRQFYEYSPQELRRMAGAKERMEKIRGHSDAKGNSDAKTGAPSN